MREAIRIIAKEKAWEKFFLCLRICHTMCELVEVKFRVFSMSALEDNSQLHAPDHCTFNHIVISVFEHGIIKM